MNVCKIIGNDMKQGVLKNKRLLFVPILCFFECMYYDNWMLIASSGRPFGKPNLPDLFIMLFRGSDPISKIADRDVKADLPYFWIAILVFAVFIGFEYMHDDLTQFGVQVITRCRKRSSWWYSKCLWCAVLSFVFYILVLATVVIYAALLGYKFTFENNYLITNTFAGASTVYKSSHIWEISTLNKVFLLAAPFMVVWTLNMLQMFLSLFIKPIYSFLISLVLIVAGTLSDTPLAFSRCSMLLYSNNYIDGAYDTRKGIIICLIIIASAIAAGMCFFKKANILPDKE